jgi:beta-lactam-binding protein with PASTA domain
LKKKPGLVLASSPAMGTNLAAGTKVALTISKK